MPPRTNNHACSYFISPLFSLSLCVKHI
uniref:Uncharacterized protein n=1 Tax=Rhizophora mucronata TaxID=61149 RepID=A0A2P2PB54_RHIMU